jgi:streptogramin lyase
VPFAHGSGLAAGGKWLWAVSKEGTVARIDPRTARIAHQWTRLAPSGNADAGEAIVADSRGAWLLSAGQGRILRLEGDRVRKVLRVDETVEPILAYSGRALWVVTSAEPTGSRLARLDPRTGVVNATVELGGHYPRALVPAPGGLWVVAGDGTVVRVAG